MKFPVLLFPLVLSSCGHTHTVEVAFDRLPVEVVMDVPNKFSATGKRIEIWFDSFSDAASADVDSFPEPPVVLRDRQGKSSCKIDRGGIWARSEVYLDRTERFVLLNEFSGSASDLVSYDAQSCREIRRIDVSGARWEIAGSQALLGEQCTSNEIKSCRKVRPLDLSIFVSLPKQ
jgi:hypothetical protein